MTSKVAVVTGGSRGIGRACAVALAEAGWTVAIGYRSNEQDAKETLEALAATGTEGLAVSLDVTDEASITEAFRRVADEAGHVTGLVNNAGYSKDGLLLRYPMDVYQQTMDVNLRGAFLCASAALRGMLREKWGRIVNVSSAVALHGNPGQTVYAATKAGLVGMTKSLAREVAPKGVTVNAICPGAIQTRLRANSARILGDDAPPMTGGVGGSEDAIRAVTPAGRRGTLAEVAAAAAYLASEEAAYVTGQTLVIDGGWTAA